MNNQEWYCLKFPVEGNTVLDVNYYIEGVNREEVKFEARQASNGVLKEISNEWTVASTEIWS